MSPAHLQPEDMVSRREAADILDVHPNTIDKMRERKLLSAYRKPGQQRLYYVRADVEKLNELQPVDEAS